MTSTVQPQESGARLGLRERKKQDKRERILASATRLFAERGYGQVTTSEIAADAQVGTGTLFRYAHSKADLLVAVMNDRVAEGIDAAVAHAEAGGDPVDAILAALTPLSNESMSHPENLIEYQKEALFGSSAHRLDVTARIADMEKAIVRVLRSTGTAPREPDIAIETVANAIYSTLYMDLVKASTGHDRIEDLPAKVRRTVAALLRAFCR